MPDRKWYTSPVVGAIVGIFAGGLTILVIESLGHALLGTANPAVPSSITTPMFLSVLIAWIAGSFVAGIVATTWARAKSVVPGVVAGFVLLAAATWNMFVLPHPVWLVLSAFLLMPAAAFAASRLRVARSVA